MSWITAVAILSKRLLKKALTEGDLSTMVAGIISNPPIPEEWGWRDALIQNRYSNGVSYLDAWRAEAKQSLHTIATERSWRLQKQRLLMLAVAANSWIALRDAILQAGANSRPHLWKSYVERIDEFDRNPEGTWPHLLQKAYVFALLHDAVYTVLYRACYGTAKARARADDHLKLYRGLRQHLIERNIKLDGGIYDLAETHPRLADLMVEAHNRIVFPVMKEAFGLLRVVADDIASGNFDSADLLRRWPQVSEQINLAMKSMKADVDAAYATAPTL